MKNTYLFIFCLLIANILRAQEPVTESGRLKHEFSVYGTGELSNLGYKFSQGDVSGSFGAGGGVGYTYNISEKIGITTGFGFAQYGAKTVANATVAGSYNYASTNPVNNFTFGYSVTGYEEKQRVTAFTIPVLVQYSLRLNGSKSFFVAGGLKFGFLTKSTASITPGNITTDIYGIYEGQPYTDLPPHGIVTNLPGSKTDSDINLGFATMLSLETGLRFPLSATTGLYTGLYFDYGLNDVKKIIRQTYHRISADKPDTVQVQQYPGFEQSG